MSERKYIRNKYALFMSKVDTQDYEHDKCWIWKGASKGNGYGNIRKGTENIPAHRYAYMLFVGDVADGLDVCHTCDNRFCVNPDHLFVGTRTANMQDCKDKGRTKGHHKVRFNEKSRQEARRLLLLGNPVGVVARALRTSNENINKLKRQLIDDKKVSL